MLLKYMFIKLCWEDNHIFKEELFLLFIFFERTTYHLEMEVREFTILTAKKTIFQKEAHVTVVYGLVHQLMCHVRLGCLPHYLSGSCLCCFSGTGFSRSPHLKSCKQQH